jgi:phosphoserine phosphatase
LKKLILFDVDSTLINEEVIDLIAAHANVQREVSAITERAMAGELNFEESLRARVSLLAGLPVSVLENVAEEITLTNGAPELIAQLQADGHIVAVVSGGFTDVIAPLMQKLNINQYKANQLEVIDKKLTGRVSGEIVGRASKAEFLREIANNEKIDLAQTIAIGDGANDLDMISAAGIGIAFCAKQVLQDAADVSINKRDLRLVLKYLD